MSPTRAAVDFRAFRERRAVGREEGEWSPKAVTVIRDQPFWTPDGQLMRAYAPQDSQAVASFLNSKTDFQSYLPVSDIAIGDVAP